MADSVINYSDLIGSDDTFDVIFANIDKLKKELNDLAVQTQKDLELINPNEEKSIEKAVKQVEELKKAEKALEMERKKAVRTRKKLADLTDEELIQREKEKIANRERVQIAKQTAILRSKESGQIEKLRAQLSLTTLQWKKLSKEELENTKRGKELVKTKLRLTNQLKRLEKQTGDTRRNVGNYSSALGRLGKIAAGVFVGRSIIDGIRRIGSGISSLIDQNKEFNQTFADLDTSFKKVSTAGQFVGTRLLEFIAPALELLAEGLTKLPALFAGIGAAAVQFAKNTGGTLRQFGLRAQIVFQNIQRVNPFSDSSTEEIEANIATLQQQIAEIGDEQGSVVDAFNEAFDATLKAQADFEKEQEKNANAEKEREKARERAEKRKEAALKRQNDLIALQTKLQQSLEQRIQAIINVQNQIEKLRAEGIKDEQERLLRLEELRAKAIREQQEKQFSAFINLLEQEEAALIEFYGENSKEVLDFREKAGKELLDAEAKQQELSEAQLKASEQRKIGIRKKFAIEEIDVVEKTRGTENDAVKKAGEEALKNAKKVTEEQKKIEEERLKSAEDKAARQKKLLEDISDTANKVGAAIIETFNKQAELASSLVEDQADAVETQRQRAEQGLSNTLAFEQEQLAQREAERLRAEKAAKQAAELLTLFNLVSAYAASGDTNALAKGLVDFSILKALESGFEEGGYTGDDGKKQIAGVVHGQEYVVTAEDTKKYGLVGRSGADFGEAMSDYFYSPLQQNMYPEQTDRFKKNVQNQSNQVSRLENEVREMRRAFERMPKNEFDMVRLTDHIVEISKRVTQNRMSKISKHKKRL